MTEHNVGNDVETANEVVQRLDRQIRVLENEIAKPQSFRVRSQLNTQLREAKALKASIQTAISTGAIKGNSPLFDRQGKPMAKPGSFLYDALKRVEAVTKGDPKGKPPSNARTYKPPPKYEVKYNEASKGGLPGQTYPGVSGYVFGLDGRTMVQKVAGEPVPGRFPEITQEGHRMYHVYNDALNPVRIAYEKTPDGSSYAPMVMEAAGFRVPGTVATYYGEDAVNPKQKMSRPDGVYDATVALPKDKSTLYPTTKATQLYIPKPGDAVVGRQSTHVHDGSQSRAPFRFTVGADIPWVGSGKSHVFGVNGQPSQKVTAQAVPGSPSTVWSEKLEPFTVQAGAFVPGSGIHSRGGIIRNKVYTSSNPSEQITWTAGADTPWDGNAATRFNIDGGQSTFAAGQAYPGQANTVFDTDFSQYTKAAGKEVPGSVGYDASNKETGDADGLGPAAQVYDAALNPIEKTRGMVVPGQAPGTVYSETGANAAITTVVPGQAVLSPKGGVDPVAIYSRSLQPIEPSRGLFRPTANPALRHTSIFTNPEQSINLATVSDPGTPEILNPKDPEFRRPSHQLSILPLADGDVVKTDAGIFTPFVFDPAFGLFVEDSFEPKIGTKESATVLFVPGRPDEIAKQTGKGALNLKTEQVFVSRLPGGPLLNDPITSDIYSGKQQPVPYQVGVETGLIPGTLADANVITIPQDGLTPTQLTVTPQRLKGSRSIMFNQGMGASTSTTSSSRSSGAARQHMQDPRSVSRW